MSRIGIPALPRAESREGTRASDSVAPAPPLTAGDGAPFEPDTVFVDLAALTVVPAVTHDGQPTLAPAPGAAAAIRHLEEAGHAVVVVGDGPATHVLRVALPEEPRFAVALPGDVSGWVITSRPELCDAARSRPGLRTIMVGAAPGAPTPDHLTPDLGARDVADAVLALLGEEAMPRER